MMSDSLQVFLRALSRQIILLHIVVGDSGIITNRIDIGNFSATLDAPGHSFSMSSSRSACDEKTTATVSHISSVMNLRNYLENIRIHILS
jgi:hypothetical protein